MRKVNKEVKVERKMKKDILDRLRKQKRESRKLNERKVERTNLVDKGGKCERK
jgi:hypothetical protein